MINTENEAEDLFELIKYYDGYIESYSYVHSIFDFDEEYNNTITCFAKEQNVDINILECILNMLNYQISKVEDSNTTSFPHRDIFNTIDTDILSLRTSFFKSLEDSIEYDELNGRFDTLTSLKLEMKMKKIFISLIDKLNYLQFSLTDDIQDGYDKYLTNIINSFYDKNYDEIDRNIEFISNLYVKPFKAELEQIKFGSASKIISSELNFNYISVDWFAYTKGINMDIKTIFYSCYLFMLEYYTLESNSKGFDKDLKQLFYSLSSEESFLDLISTKTKRKGNIDKKMFFPKQIHFKKNSFIPQLQNYL